MADKKDAFLIARVPTDLKKQILNKAGEVGLSVSEFVRRIVEKHLNK